MVRLAHQVERARQTAFPIDAPLHGILHDRPYLAQEIPYAAVFTHAYIFPITTARGVTPLHDFRHGGHVVDLGRIERACVFLAFGKRATPYAVHCPFIRNVAFSVVSLQFHAIGMERQEDGRLPVDAHGCYWLQFTHDGHVGHVAAPSSRQTAIEGYGKRARTRIAVGEYPCRPLRSHGMAARWTLAYSVKFLQ